MLNGTFDQVNTDILPFLMACLLVMAWAFWHGVRYEVVVIWRMGQAARGVATALEKQSDTRDTGSLFSSHEPLKAAYHRFQEQCFEVSGQPCSEQSAHRFFSTEALVYPDLLHSRAPERLTTLGILGTFVGVIFGLVPFANQLGGNTGVQEAAAGDLLSSVGIAFVTSAAGLLMALILSVGHSQSHKQLERAYFDIASVLDSRFSRGGSQRLLQSLHAGMTGEDGLVAAIRTMTDELKGAIANTQDRRIESAVEALQASMAGLVKQADTLAALFRDTATGQEAMNVLLADVRGELEPATARIVEATVALDAATKQLGPLMTELTEWVQGQLEKFQKGSGELATSSATLAEQVSTFSRVLTTLKDGLDTASQAAIEASTATTGSTAKLSELLQTTAQRETAVLDRWNRLEEGLNQAVTDYQSTLSKLSESEREAYQKEVQSVIEQTFGHINTYLTGATNRLSTMIALLEGEKVPRA